MVQEQGQKWGGAKKWWDLSQWEMEIRLAHRIIGPEETSEVF